MIVRDLRAAASREFDLVVIGGGIYGASVLQEAARRGLRACLCEAGDFGGATSWNSLRIAHGGLRCLQDLDLSRFGQFVAARRSLALRFPSLVRPLEFLMPLYGRGLRRRPVMQVGLWLNDVLSRHRNEGLPEPLHVPDGRVLDAAATREAFGQVRAEGLDGAAAWCDYRMLSPERILMELLRDACRHGALALNYLPVTGLLRDGKIIRGVRVHDPDAGSFEIAARVVVNCAGPWLAEVAEEVGGNTEGLFQPSLAFNLLLDRRLPVRSALAVAAPEPGAPLLFVVPQERTLLAGTLHRPRPQRTTEAVATEAEINEYLRQLNAAIPGLGAEPRHVLRVFAGLLPAIAAGSRDLARRELVRDHGRAGGARGLYSVAGVKFTTAGEVAARLLDRIDRARSPVAEVCELPLSPATALLTDARAMLAAAPDECAAMLRQVAAEESVRCPDDLLLRRTNWAATEPDLAPLRARVAAALSQPS